MIPMNIRFHADREEVIFPDIEKGQGQEADLTEVVVVANGVADPGGGPDRPSIVIRFNLPDGKVGIALTTARLLLTLADMVRAKYPDLMEGPVKPVREP